MGFFSGEQTVSELIAGAMQLPDDELVDLFHRLRQHIATRSSIREKTLSALHDAIGYVPKEDS